MPTTFRNVLDPINRTLQRSPLGRLRLGLKLLAILLVAVVLVPSMLTYINPGHVGIVIHRVGGGVDEKPLGSGLHFQNPLTTEIEEYPTYMQTLLLARSSGDGSRYNEEINVNSMEGQPLSMDVSMSFELMPERVPYLYQTFRTDINAIQHGYVKQSIRQALQEVVGSEEISAIIGPKKAETVTHTQTLLTQRLSSYGIAVKQFTINELRAPETVIQAINAKNVMQQQALTAQNELQKKRFEALGDSIQATGKANAILMEAGAQAKANALLSQSLTANLVQYETMKRWDGKLPQVASGAMPMIQLPNTRQ